jgi:hypothetical protein
VSGGTILIIPNNSLFYLETQNTVFGSSRINVIFPLFENQHFIYLRLIMVITIWIYSNLAEMSVVVPPNP